MEFLIGETLDVIGTVMIAFTVLMVHHRFRKEHKVDERVFKAMRREQVIGLLGIAFIVIGYFFRLPLFL